MLPTPHIEVTDDVVVSSGIVVSNDMTGGAIGGGTIAGGTAPAQVINKLEEVGETIAEVCQTLQKRIQTSLGPSKPTELTLEFGVKLAGETGIPLVTKGSMEGSFQVTAKWDFSKDKKEEE